MDNVSWIEPKLVNWFEILQTSSLLSSLDACITVEGWGWLPEATCMHQSFHKSKPPTSSMECQSWRVCLSPISAGYKLSDVNVGYLMLFMVISVETC